MLTSHHHWDRASHPGNLSRTHRIRGLPSVVSLSLLGLLLAVSRRQGGIEAALHTGHRAKSRQTTLHSWYWYADDILTPQPAVTPLAGTAWRLRRRLPCTSPETRWQDPNFFPAVRPLNFFRYDLLHVTSCSSTQDHPFAIKLYWFRLGIW
jgi:hypothetical protein